MQGICIIPVIHELICHIFGFLSSAAKYYPINVGIHIGNSLKCFVPVLCVGHEIFMRHIISPGVLRSNRYLFRGIHVLICYPANFIRHGG